MTERYDLREIAVSAPLCVRLATDGTRRYAFVFNYTDKTVTGRLTGGGFDREITVAPNDVVILWEDT